MGDAKEYPSADFVTGPGSIWLRELAHYRGKTTLFLVKSPGHFDLIAFQRFIIVSKYVEDVIVLPSELYSV